MRFRTNIENVTTFSRIMQTVDKLQKRCIVKFTETHMHIICNTETEDGIQVWSQIKVDSLFSEYRIQSNANNEINLELSPEALQQVLKSASNATEIVMKLAKKNNHAVLSFEIVGQSRQRNTVRVCHDVLIDVLKPSEVEKLKEPLCPAPDIHILLPPLQKLRTVVEHMRQMSNAMAIHANHLGELRLQIDTDAVKVETQWSKCTIPNMCKFRQFDPLCRS